MSDQQPQTMSRLLDRVLDAAEGESVQIEEIVAALGTRSYGPILAFTSLIELLPVIGAIPGMYIVTGLIVILLAGQLLLLRSEPWLPRRIRNIRLPRQKLMRAVKRSRPWARRIDRIFAARLTVFVRPPFLQLIAAICILMALLFFPLAIIPSSEKVLAAPVFFFGLALTVNDGLLALIGLAISGALITLPILYWPQFTQVFSYPW